jgi:hypothetical protein
MSEEEHMCPMCLANAALIAGSATSGGGLAFLAIKRLGVKNAVDHHSAPTPSDYFEERTEQEK